MSNSQVRAGLPAHLADTYGFDVTGSSLPEAWNDGVIRVDRRRGCSWIVRVFPPERPIDRVEGDAAVLRFLEDQGYPAERCADAEPISVLGGRPLLVTECLPGHTGRTRPVDPEAVGELNGRLHALPVPEGPVSRPAGCWHATTVHGGTRADDVASLVPQLHHATARVTGHERDAMQSLIRELESIDLCEDLPHCLINVDLGGPNVVQGPDGSLSGIDWTDAGRGPRLQAFGSLTAGVPVEPYLRGYAKHVELGADEIERLPRALEIHGLIIWAWMVLHQGQPASKALEALTATRGQIDGIMREVQRFCN